MEDTIAVRDDDGGEVDTGEAVVDLAATRLLGESAVGLIEDTLEVDLLVPNREPMRL